MAFGFLAPFPVRLGGQRPDAASWLDMLRSMLGSAFTVENISFRGYRSMALARHFAGVAQFAEKIERNSLPATSDDSLMSWADRLGVIVRPRDTASAIRAVCAAKYQAQQGAQLAVVQDSVAAVLGSALVTIHYINGSDLATPPDPTEWPNENPGPAEYDLGGVGPWLSARCYVLVEATQPATMTYDDFLFLINVRLFELLDTLMPAWVSFAVATDIGFNLDIDPLDLTAFD